MSAPGPSGPYPPGSHPPPAPPSVTAAPVRPVDVTVTIVLIVVLAFLGVVSLTLGLLFVMASDGCDGDRACYDRVGVGVLLIELAPILAWLPTTVWAIVRMVRRKVAFWVPLLALPLYLVIAVAGLMTLAG